VCVNRLIPIVFLPLIVGVAQLHVGVQVPKDAPDRAAAKPEPRQRIFAEPSAIVQKLLSPSEETRRIGFRQLGIPPESLRSRTAQVDDVRLFATNLDSDDDLERVLVFTINPDTTALVFDRSGDGWWQVGAFSCWYCGDRLVEVQPSVAYTHNDLIVRVRGTGTGIVRTELTIYRLAAGRLYRVFRTIEEEDYDTSGPGTAGAWYFERRKLIFPASDNAGRRFLIVHHTKATDQPTTAPDRAPPCRPRSISCSVY
jgi:hypothetical protein